MGQANSKVEEEKSGYEEDDEDGVSEDGGIFSAPPGSPGGPGAGVSFKAANSAKEQHQENNSEFAIKYHVASGGGNGRGPFKNLAPIDLALKAAPTANEETDGNSEEKSTHGEGAFADVMAFFIYCPRHGRFALYTDAQSGAIWLPFLRLPDST